MKLPFEVKAILNSYSVYQQPAYIAGGAVRDSIFDKPIKDWDIFIQSEDGKDEAELRILADRIGMSFCVLGEADPAYNKLGFDVYQLRKDDLIIECVVSKETIDEAIDRFSCNASQVYWDHNKGEEVYTDQFAEFLCTGTLVFKWITKNSYIERIAEKYPECDVTVTRQF